MSDDQKYAQSRYKELVSAPDNQTKALKEARDRVATSGQQTTNDQEGDLRSLMDAYGGINRSGGKIGFDSTDEEIEAKQRAEEALGVAKGKYGLTDAQKTSNKSARDLLAKKRADVAAGQGQMESAAAGAGRVPTSDKYGSLYGGLDDYAKNSYQDVTAERLMGDATGQTSDALDAYKKNSYQDVEAEKRMGDQTKTLSTGLDAYRKNSYQDVEAEKLMGGATGQLSDALDAYKKNSYQDVEAEKLMGGSTAELGSNLDKYAKNSYQDVEAEKLMGQATGKAGEFATNEFGKSVTEQGGLVDKMLDRGFSREEQALDFARKQEEASQGMPTDVSLSPRIQSAMDLYDQTAGEELKNQMSLMGLGRSTVKGTALARGKASMLAPLVQQEYEMQERGIGRKMEGAKAAADTFLQAAGQGVDRAATGGQLGLQASEAQTNREQEALGKQYQGMQDEIKNRRDLSESQKQRELQSLSQKYESSQKEIANRRGLSESQKGREGEALSQKYASMQDEIKNRRDLSESQKQRELQSLSQEFAASQTEIENRRGLSESQKGREKDAIGQKYTAMQDEIKNRRDLSESQKAKELAKIQSQWSMETDTLDRETSGIERETSAKQQLADYLMKSGAMTNDQLKEAMNQDRGEQEAELGREGTVRGDTMGSLGRLSDLLTGQSGAKTGRAKSAIDSLNQLQEQEMGRAESAKNRETAASGDLVSTLFGAGGADADRFNQMLDWASKIGGTDRDIQLSQEQAKQAERTRLQGLAENSLFGPMGGFLPSTLGSATSSKM